MTYLQTLLQTIPGRDIRTQAVEDRIAKIKSYLETNSHMSWTEGYKARLAELATLEAR